MCDRAPSFLWVENQRSYLERMSGSYGFNLQTLGCQVMRVDQWSAVFGPGGACQHPSTKNSNEYDDDDGIYAEDEEEATFWFADGICSPVNNSRDNEEEYTEQCNPTTCRMASGVCVDCTRCLHHCNCTPLSPSQASTAKRENSFEREQSSIPLEDLRTRAVYLIRDSSLVEERHRESSMMTRGRSLEREDRPRSLEREDRPRQRQHKERRPPQYQDVRQSSSSSSSIASLDEVWKYRHQQDQRLKRVQTSRAKKKQPFPRTTRKSSDYALSRDRSLTTKQRVTRCDPTVCKQLICGDCSRCVKHCMCNWEQERKQPLRNRPVNQVEDAFLQGLQRKRTQSSLRYSY